MLTTAGTSQPSAASWIVNLDVPSGGIAGNYLRPQHSATADCSTPNAVDLVLAAPATGLVNGGQLRTLPFGNPPCVVVPSILGATSVELVCAAADAWAFEVAEGSATSIPDSRLQQVYNAINEGLS